jgi:excisionase family DNA binding protein
MKIDKTASSYLSTTQAAQRLGLSVGTVQRMVEAGVLQAYTTQGGHRRILSSSLNHYCRGASGASDTGLRVCVLADPAHPVHDGTALGQIASLQLVTNPLELAGLHQQIHVLFLDARIPWLPWHDLHLADSLGTEAHCIVYNSADLPEPVRAALLTQATLYPGDVSADLVQGYLLGSTAIQQRAHHHPTTDQPGDLPKAHH